MNPYQSDSYESTVAHHGMTDADYLARAGFSVLEIPLEDRLRLAISGATMIQAPAVEEEKAQVIAKNVNLVSGQLETLAAPLPIREMIAAPVNVVSGQLETLAKPLKLRGGCEPWEHDAGDPKPYFEDGEAEEIFSMLAKQMHPFVDIAETLEIYGVTAYQHDGVLTLSTHDGAEIEIPENEAMSDARRALLESLAPLGLLAKRGEIRYDWRLLMQRKASGETGAEWIVPWLESRKLGE